MQLLRVSSLVRSNTTKRKVRRQSRAGAAPRRRSARRAAQKHRPRRDARARACFLRRRAASTNSSPSSRCMYLDEHVPRQRGGGVRVDGKLKAARRVLVLQAFNAHHGQASVLISDPRSSSASYAFVQQPAADDPQPWTPT
eukprot:3456685-Pleurochrysis_carterae.AAC.1